MDDVTAVLFCGGRGTRLYPVTDYYQKVMMPLGQYGVPMLEYVIKWLSKFGITKFVALIRYRANQIRRYFGDGSNFNVDISYVLDNPNLVGTGGALLNAQQHINTDEMLIYYTDILSNFNVQDMYKYHKNHNKIGTSILDKDWTVEEGIVKVGDGYTINSLTRKPDQEIFANTGISFLNQRCFEYLDQLAYQDQEKVDIDLSGHLFPYLAENDEMKAYFMEEWWLDVGSLTRHQLISQELLEEKFGGLIQ